MDDDAAVLPDFESALARARELAARPGRSLLGICGSPGAGKTTLAEALRDELTTLLGPGTVAHVPMDGFHLADVELTRLGRLDRKGAPDTFDAAGYAAMLARLRAAAPAEVVYAPQFERDLEQPVAGAIPVESTVRLVISEGNYLLADSDGWSGVAGLFDEVWFIESSPEQRVPRLVGRHVLFGKEPAQAQDWVRHVDERNAATIENSKVRASVRVTGFVPPQR